MNAPNNLDCFTTNILALVHTDDHELKYARKIWIGIFFKLSIFFIYSTSLAHPVDVYDKCTLIKWLCVVDGDKQTTSWQRD